MNVKEELMKVLTKGQAEAIMRKCEEENETIIEFLLNLANDLDDDGFSDYIGNLCDDYGIEEFDEDDW